MAGPPKDVKPSELWLKLQERPRPSDVAEFPREGAGNVRLQVLTLQEQDEARLRAKSYCTAALGMKPEELELSPGKEILGDAAACEVLAIACLDEKPIEGTEGSEPRYRRIFASAKDIKSALSGDEVAALFAAYLLVQRRFGPTEATVHSEAELNEWIKKLGEGAREYPLAASSWQALVELATLLGVRAYSLSQHLACRLSSSQPISDAPPESWGVGTFFSGAPPAKSTPTGGEISPSESAPTGRLLSSDVITAADAVSVARAIRNQPL